MDLLKNFDENATAHGTSFFCLPEKLNQRVKAEFKI
jgi:hypothetical protein